MCYGFEISRVSFARYPLVFWSIHDRASGLVCVDRPLGDRLDYLERVVEIGLVLIAIVAILPLARKYIFRKLCQLLGINDGT